MVGRTTSNPDLTDSIGLTRMQQTKSSVSTMSDMSDDERRRVSTDSIKEGLLSESGRPPASQRGWLPRRRLLLLLVAGGGALIWLICLFTYLAAGRWHAPGHAPTAHTRRLGFEDYRHGQFSAIMDTVHWTEDGDHDGVYLRQDTDSIQMVNVQTGESHAFVHADDITWQGNTLEFDKYWISPDRAYVLLASKVSRVFRHSFKAQYWLHELASKKTSPLMPGSPDAFIDYAAWSPSGHSLAFVAANNVYVRTDLEDPEEEPAMVTVDGHATVFNGVPDWVYEEEIFQTNSAIWWSPDSSSFVFMRTDERAVRTYELEYFIGADKDSLYPDIEPLKYPRPGTSNPVVALKHYELETGKIRDVPLTADFEATNRLVTEVKYLNDHRVLLRQTNRDSTVQQVSVYDTRAHTDKLVRRLNVTEIDGGWFEVMRDTVPYQDGGYIGLEISDGNLHLALHSPDNLGGTPKMLTSGDWEVVKGASKVDTARGLVYFVATRKSSIERHVYSVDIATGEIRAITDESKPGYFSVSFSKKAGYYLLSYHGPGVPWQEIRSVDDPTFSKVVNRFDKVREQVAKFDLPIRRFHTIKVDGYELNVMEQLPPNFDETGKTHYPVLFRPYGGPISQSVSRRFDVDWHDYLASDPTTEYISVCVDGRGTGFKGRPLRSPIRGKLGYFESYDQLAVAQVWRAKPYTDKSKFAIWGWSFGGYLTLKTLERQASADPDILKLLQLSPTPGRRPPPGLAGETKSDLIFPYGMAVAPVTDWRLYDSVYSERYMGVPSSIGDDAEKSAVDLAYDETAVGNMTSLGTATRFLIAHGTGDDNVHFQNSLKLIDNLNLANAQNFDTAIFPDSDHSIYFHNANPQVYRRLTTWLRRAFGVRDPHGEDRGWRRDPESW
ncbi:hypothetical protein PYCC9005_000680 [Savitreella phatthalungensis]